MKDLCITWPKSSPLDSYIQTLAEAHKARQLINFRVPTLPKSQCERCYIVYDGKIRGWNRILEETYRGPEEVRNTHMGGFWPEGNYIVRTALWHPFDGPAMKGFQGYRYIDRPEGS